MTDRDALCSLLARFGIPSTESPIKEREYDYNAGGDIEHPPGRTRITVEQGGDKVGGYFGFFATFDFEPDGRFVKMGVWE